MKRLVPSSRPRSGPHFPSRAASARSWIPDRRTRMAVVAVPEADRPRTALIPMGGLR